MGDPCHHVNSLGYYPPLFSDVRKQGGNNHVFLLKHQFLVYFSRLRRAENPIFERFRALRYHLKQQIKNVIFELTDDTHASVKIS